MDEEKKDLPVVGADGVQEPVDPEAEQRKAEQEEREKKQKQKLFPDGESAPAFCYAFCKGLQKEFV